MITDWLFSQLEALGLWLAGLMPDATDPGSSWDNLGALTANLTALNYWLPISELASFVIGVFLVFPALAGASLVVWVASFIRGASARG